MIQAADCGFICVYRHFRGACDDDDDDNNNNTIMRNNNKR
jgi:hypothetical protein